MTLIDSHTHTQCSPDSTEPLALMAQAAHERGLACLYTTDHYDIVADGVLCTSFDWQPVIEQFQSVKAAFAEKLPIRLGLELGGAPADPALAEQILAQAPLDFVIGSVHAMSMEKGGRDFFFLEYPTLERCNAILDDYMISLRQLASLKCYDSMAHVVYPIRYMQQVGHNIDLMSRSDELRDIFITLVENERALEVNTNRGKSLNEWRSILKLYHDCGGEMVTIGSDAHEARHVGYGIADAQQLLIEAGFRYFTAFVSRKPQFIKL